MKMRQHRKRQAGMSRFISVRREYRAKCDAFADSFGAEMVRYLGAMQEAIESLARGVCRCVLEMAIPPADPKEWH